MTAEDRPSWLQLQRQREERMRFEVLTMLHQATEGKLAAPCNVSTFADQLGVWRAEVYRTVEWLDRQGLIRYMGAGPTVSLTAKGASVLERADGRRSIRDGEV